MDELYLAESISQVYGSIHAFIESNQTVSTKIGMFCVVGIADNEIDLVEFLKLCPNPIHSIHRL